MLSEIILWESLEECFMQKDEEKCVVNSLMEAALYKKEIWLSLENYGCSLFQLLLMVSLLHDDAYFSTDSSTIIIPSLREFAICM